MSVSSKKSNDEDEDHWKTNNLFVWILDCFYYLICLGTLYVYNLSSLYTYQPLSNWKFDWAWAL